MTQEVINKEVNEINKAVKENNLNISSGTNNKPIPSNNKPIPSKDMPEKNKLNRKPRSSKASTKKSSQHLIVGKHVNSESGFSFACSENSSFREILIDFAKTIDTSLNKTKSTLYADILSNLSKKEENIKMSFLLLEEMFGYKVLLICEVSKLFYGKDFIEQLKKKMNDTNDPLPF